MKSVSFMLTKLSAKCRTNNRIGHKGVVVKTALVYYTISCTWHSTLVFALILLALKCDSMI